MKDEALPKVIAIDGPAGSGKSTVAGMLAKEIGWTYVTTGAIYRTLAWLLCEAGENESNVSAVDSAVARLRAEYRQNSDNGRVYIGKKDVTEAIRSPQASERASIVAQNVHVRELLLPVQRRVVLEREGAVVDGRDMGTVVFPDAPLKVFLTAASEERARRRAVELRARGVEVDMVALTKEIDERDARDASREVAPMKAATDALVLDSTLMSPRQVVDFVLAEAIRRGIVVASKEER